MLAAAYETTAASCKNCTQLLLCDPQLLLCDPQLLLCDPLSLVDELVYYRFGTFNSGFTCVCVVVLSARGEGCAAWSDCAEASSEYPYLTLGGSGPFSISVT
jgi:hypothetical protein